MNSAILARASKIVPETQLLVNVVRLRVRQLASGYRPLIEVPPGMGLSDVALSEIAAGKLSSEPIATFVSADAAEVPIIAFPTATPKKKAA
jgi:DNA-directed RNA polymerase subunit omega